MKYFSSINPDKAASLRPDKSNFKVASNGLHYLDDSFAVQCTLSLPTELEQGTLKYFTEDEVEKVLSRKVINWSNSFSRLIPLRTSADHNCLCHAASISMWGVQDRSYCLRQAISDTLNGNGSVVSKIRYNWKCSLVARDIEAFGSEIERTHSQWQDEWDQELELASDFTKSLTEVHVFVLSNILRRPIIVYSPDSLVDHNGQSSAPIYFAGIYLPLLWDPSFCVSRSPLLMAYLDSHFTALIPIEEKKMMIPLATAEGKGLPIQFQGELSCEPGSHKWLKILSDYLDLEISPEIPCLAARIHVPQSGELVKELVNIQRQKRQARSRTPTPPTQVPLHKYSNDQHPTTVFKIDPKQNLSIPDQTQINYTMKSNNGPLLSSPPKKRNIPVMEVEGSDDEDDINGSQRWFMDTHRPTWPFVMRSPLLFHNNI